MTRVTNMKLIPALLLMAFAGTASAAGFALQNQAGSGNGNAFAGAAAAAEDASTVFFNPAGMTYLPEGHSVSASVTVLDRSIKYTESGTSSNVGIPSTGTNGGDGGGVAVFPAGYYSYSLSPKLRLGLGVSPTFGNKTEYDSNFIGRRSGYMAHIKQININPSLAYRLNDKLSLGFGVNVAKNETEFLQKFPNGAGTVDIRIKGDDIAYGWNAGAMYQVSPSTRLGLTYRSAISFELEGTMSSALLGPDRSVKAKLKTPDSASMAVSQKLSDRWEMLGDVTWTGWSTVQTLVVENAATPTALSYNFKDTWRVGLGANYQLNNAWKLRFGVARDQSPVRSAADRTMTLPDTDRTWLSFGAKWKLSPASSVDFGYSHIFFKGGDTERAVSAAGTVVQTIRGNWDSNSANIFSAQYNHTF